MENIEKLGFVKTDKNIWAFWNDYLLKDINPKIGHFLNCTLHVPKSKSGQYEYDVCKIILHRAYDRDFWSSGSDYYDIEKVYEGYIDNVKELEHLLKRLGIKQ